MTEGVWGEKEPSHYMTQLRKFVSSKLHPEFRCTVIHDVQNSGVRFFYILKAVFHCKLHKQNLSTIFIYEIYSCDGKYKFSAAISPVFNTTSFF